MNSVFTGRIENTISNAPSDIDISATPFSKKGRNEAGMAMPDFENQYSLLVPAERGVRHDYA